MTEAFILFKIVIQNICGIKATLIKIRYCFQHARLADKLVINCMIIPSSDIDGNIN